MKNSIFPCLIIITVIYISSCAGGASNKDDGFYYEMTEGGDYMSDEYYEDQEDVSNEKYNEITENPFILTSEEATSTFSIDADGAAYANARRYITKYDRLPPANAVRTEELINYFTFDYPEGDNPVTLNAETTTCPWNDSNLLMRIGLKGKNLDELPASNLVFLIDVSGSMSSEDKLTLLKEGLMSYVDLIDDDDKVSIVTYAGSAGVLIDGGSGADKEGLKSAIQRLGAGGSTAGAQGIITAYDIAQKHFIHGGNNRIILGTDGDFNVGPSSQEDLISLIETKQDEGVYLTVLGLGTGNLNEAMMEQLANNGNGNYEYLDSSDELIKVFVFDYLKFFTVAKDVKIQVHFDSTTVESYRLIGYENRKLNNEDFEDDQKDAGELGADQTVTALYEIVPMDASSANFNVAQVDLRYKDGTTSSILTDNMSVDYTGISFSEASENTRFAASIVGFGMILRDSEYKGTVSWGDVVSWAEDSHEFDPHELRAGYIDLLYKAQGMQ